MALRLVCVVALLSAGGFGQSIGLQSTVTGQKVELRIRLFTQDGRRPLDGVHAVVRLMDGFGTTQEERMVDSEATVRFNTTPGYHRIRVTGENIEEYTGVLDLSNTTMHVELLRITLKKPANAVTPIPRRPVNPQNPDSTIEGGATVDVKRLNVPGKAEEQFKKGSEALQQRDWEAARKEFQAAVDTYPKYDLAYNGIGVAEYMMGNVAVARDAFEKALAANDHFAGAYRNLARIYLAEQDWARVDDLLTKSLQTEPLNAWALTNAAYAQLQEKKYDQALANARRVHTLEHKGFAKAHYIAARALEGRGQTDEAIAEYNQYLKEAPTGADALDSQAAIERIKPNAQSSKPN